MSFTGIGPMLLSMAIDRWMGARLACADEPIRSGSSSGHMGLRSRALAWLWLVAGDGSRLKADVHQ